MDPTLQQAPGQQAMPAGGVDPTSQALQNALMLQAIKAGATGGGAPPAGATAAAMTPSPMQPTDPSAMPGGLGGQAAMMPQNQQMAMQPNPVAAALMSQIPGAQ